MLVEIDKKKLCINQIIGQKTENVVAEGDVIVNDTKPDVVNIINTNGIVSVYKKEVMEGRIRLDGSINTYIIYLADSENGSVRSLNTVLDFTQFIDIDNCKSGMRLDENVNIKQFECTTINSRKINVKADLEIEVKIYSNEDMEIIDEIGEIEDIQTLDKEIEINSLIGEGDTKTYVKETISVDIADDLAEIMQAKFKLINKEAKVSYNKVLVKADCDVDIMYLTEDGRINAVNTKLPVMGFIDVPNINDNNTCDTRYKLKNIIVKPNNMEPHSIYIEAEIEIICFIYEVQPIRLIEDLYSTRANINFTKKQIIAMSGESNIKEICSIKEQMNIPEIGGNKIYDVHVKPEIINMRSQKGKVFFEGELELKFLFEANKVMNTKNIKLPFNFEIVSDAIDENVNVEPHIEINKENFVVISDGNIEAEIELEFNLNMSKERKIDIIEEITLEEAKKNNSYSMTIYFVKPEDTLWKIAKTLRSTIDDIQRVNEIEGERIFTGQQLYIPKYVRRNVNCVKQL